MVKQTQNFETMIQDAMNAFPVKADAFENGFKHGAELNETLTNIVVDAAGRSTELSAQWTKQTLADTAELTRAKSDPAAYVEAMSRFATAQTEAASERFMQFAEVAKSAQLATVEALMSAGKTWTDAAEAAPKKAATATKRAASAAAAAPAAAADAASK
ncbi:hypothetical protein [Roseivivax isoporae]|uniref:Phasin, PhaP n=1 Tax=Roseivivax isoporae LMG 25204 TaxID=1449351 RepID=X7FDB6_9RHOB|nr:hypothetical protein [Roseivivax isoporae]ETX30056.1 phasin, PhaP [Roseivivax isoporae LMG 25204]